MTAPPETTPPQIQYEPERPRIGITLGKFIAGLAVIGLGFAAIVNVAPRLADVVAADNVAAGPSLPAGEEVEVEVASGSSATGIARQLEDEGLIVAAGDFERAVRVGGVADQLKAGTYTLIGGMSVPQIIEVLVLGPPPMETYRVTVIEGLRMSEVLESLAEQTPYTEEELTEALLDGDVTSPYLPDSLPAGTDPIIAWEGLLFPATYDFVEDASAETILQRLSDEMSTRIGRVDWTELEAKGLSIYEGLIIASLIEDEAKIEEERPVISSVIHNRLAEEMLLQIDATVIFALGENPGRVLNEHLEIDSPWNTYRNAGLPPTPIGGVRDTSMIAAAQPDDTGYFYYVLVDTDGTHGFSETLDEHNAKVEQARQDGVLEQ